jgi:hypothetical protein
MGLVGRVFLGGAWHFLLTTFIVIAGIVGTVFLYRKMFAKWSEETTLKNWICLGIALALAITGLTSKNWFAPSNMRWKRIAPVAFRLVDEIKYKLTEAEKRGDYAEGIELLGGQPNAEYPFVKCTASASKCEEYRQHDFAQFKARDRKPVFCRLAVAADLDECRPTLSTIPYNQTVVVNLTGGQEEIISRIKKRGRRDVRKALRETPATYADETEKAAASFEEYFQVMVSTAERDGFTPGTCESYESMVRVLGPEHCRVFAGRVDGRLASWAIMNVNGERAVYYYGASRSDIEKRSFVTDGLIIYAATRLSEMGCTSLDMMGVGNDFAPSLKSLNTFKCKFAEGLTDVAPDRDVPLRPVLYASLVKARSLLHARDDKDA